MGTKEMIWGILSNALLVAAHILFVLKPHFQHRHFGHSLIKDWMALRARLKFCFESEPAHVVFTISPQNTATDIYGLVFHRYHSCLPVFSILIHKS